MIEEPSLQPDNILNELRRSEDFKSLEVFRTLINLKSKSAYNNDAERATRWKPVIIELIRLLATSEEIGDERVLLGSIAFIVTLFTNSSLEDLTNHLRTYWSLETTHLSAFDEDFQIRDLEWFKLVITHGYLNVNIKRLYVPEIIALPFEVLQRNCLRYTKYSYFAYKTLQSWLEKSAKTSFWHENDENETERKLEAIIFSNWDSCICEIARRNATEIFPTYLRIMSNKYEYFGNLIFENCVQNLSWQNETKYSILAEVCNILIDLSMIVSSDLPACIFTSLTKNHLKHAGTKLYLTILKKIQTADEWQNIFGKNFLLISEKWEDEEQLTAVQLLWEQWMEPTMKKFSKVFEYLWKNDSMKRLQLNRSYLERIGDRLNFALSYDGTNIHEVLSHRIEDFSEPVRLNAFAVICQNKNWKYANKDEFTFVDTKRFLYFNIDTSSVSMRKGIIKNFTIFIGNMQKLCITDDGSSIDFCRKQKVDEFFYWLHNFLIDCLEIGSCYQRKILALSLYRVILDSETSTSSKKLPLISANIYLEKAEWIRNFIDRRSLIVFLRLVFDQMADVREKSARIIVDYLYQSTFSSEECKTLEKLADRYCNSSKFYEAASGSILKRVTLLGLNKPCDVTNLGALVIDCLLRQAENQLKKMKKSQDILNCAVNGSPFFGSMMTILELALPDDPSLSHVKLLIDNADRLLKIAENATDFFLSALSSKATQFEYSSSFEEMALAIEESIRNSEVNENAEECILSSSHQLVVSCIWMSLKVCCEVAANIGALIADDVEDERKIIPRAANLIVSVLLKCRHKGAIEAAGLSLAKLTKVVCKTNYSDVIETHLSDLLKMDGKDNINLTRRGAGMSIMFHRIVSNDDRRNRPTLHFAVKKLSDSLKKKNEDTSKIREEDCIRDSSIARHLHFLRSLVADKSLQAQLVPYMEDTCLTCFEYLQSPEWIVRNASLQLFGAIVPRLVGQCSARELDYGIGNSVDHFVTHYPLLAINILMKLESLASSFNIGKNIRRVNFYVDSNVVPILTLFSKMSTGGCDLVDYSSKEYLSRAKFAFVRLFGHPVFHVRALASKAYAAFVALPNIPQVLAELKLEIVDNKSNNYQHGQLLAQINLGRKLNHEMQCTIESFFIRKHKLHEYELKRGLNAQLQRLNSVLRHYLDFEERQFCHTVNTTLIECLIESHAFFSVFNVRPTIDDTFTDKFDCSLSQPGSVEFVRNLEVLRQMYSSDTSRAVHEPEYPQYDSDVKLLTDDDSLLSRINEISKKLYDDDTDVKILALDLIPRLVRDSIDCENYEKFVFDPRSEYSKLWIEVIIGALTDEDPEVRESMTEILHPITRIIIGHSTRPLCAKSVCHKILNKLLFMRMDDCSKLMTENLFEIFRRLTNIVKINEAREGLKSPFNQDETFLRDYTSFLNILLYCVKTLTEFHSSTISDWNADLLEVKQISDIINVNETSGFESVVDFGNVQSILQLSTSDYLSCKKRFLMKMIDEYRSVKDHELIGDSNSP